MMTTVRRPKVTEASRRAICNVHEAIYIGWLAVNVDRRATRDELRACLEETMRRARVAYDVVSAR
jgi:hypothetical protein